MLWQDMFVESLRFQAKGDLYMAIEYLNKILLVKPDFTPAWNNRASMIAQLGQPFDAIVNYDRAIAVDPEAFEFYNNRGAAYMDLDMFERALEDFDTAMLKGGRIPEIFNNKGACHRRLGRIEESLKEYKTATEVGPNYVDGHLGYSFCLLQLGQFEEGWKEYEWRWKSSQSPARNLPYPEWQGEQAKDDDILLLYGEQGMGDIIQFMRYYPLAKAIWQGKVFLEVRHPVVRLAETMKDVDRVVSFGEMLPDGIVACAPLMSLPRILWPYHNEIPSKCPYIYADKHRVDIFREQLKAMPPGMLVGVCWAGMNRDTNPLASSIDKRRSLTLNSFSTVADAVPDLAWISLQMGPPSPQCRKPPRNMAIGDFTADFYDFYDTAAMVENLDLVITVDTSVAHLAGALGKPVWMLSRFDNCWRWRDNSEYTPWYPSMRIFGQKQMGDWDEVMERVAREMQFLRRNWKQQKAA